MPILFATRCMNIADTVSITWPALRAKRAQTVKQAPGTYRPGILPTSSFAHCMRVPGICDFKCPRCATLARRAGPSYKLSGGPSKTTRHLKKSASSLQGRAPLRTARAGQVC